MSHEAFADEQLNIRHAKDNSRIITFLVMIFLEQFLDPPIIDKPDNHLALFINHGKVRITNSGFFLFP